MAILVNKSFAEPATPRQQWKEATAGRNLIQNSPAWFSVQPNWGTMPPEKKLRILSDGILSRKLDEGDFETLDCLRWAWSERDVVVLFDLGTEQPIEKVVARFYGGLTSKALDIHFPKEIEVIASNDKRTFHRISKLTHVLAAEKDTVDWKKSYFLEKKPKGYPYIFTLEAGVEARYIGLRMVRHHNKIIADEIAVIEGGSGSPLQKFPETSLIVDSAAVMPRDAVLWITDISTPIWFQGFDTRKKENRAQLEVTLDLPSEVEVVGWGVGVTPTIIQPERDGRVVYRLPIVNTQISLAGDQGPLYLKSKVPLPDKGEPLYAILRTKDKEIIHEKRVEIRPLAIPFAGDWSGFSISLGWMGEQYAMGWPGFFDSYRHLGFNEVPSFPRDFGKLREERVAFLNGARKKGFGIIYNESPLHVLQNQWAKTNPEIMNQVDGQPGKHLSPIYRGEKYDAEMKRVAENFVLLGGADRIFWDIELWDLSLSEAVKDPAYQKALKDSGLPEKEFLNKLGAEQLRDLKKAVSDAATQHGLATPKIGLYGQTSFNSVSGFFNWDQIYPNDLQFSMPSLYIQGDVARVHDMLRKDYDKVQARKTVPWLTPRTFGEYDPVRLEFQIYETLLNGGEGLTYYWFGDFNPRYFYHHALALRTLHPYKQIIEDGKPVDLTGADNNALRYSCMANKGKYLILIGNYNSSQAVEAKVTLPAPEIVRLVDLRSGKELPLDRNLRLEIPGNDCRLIYAEQAGKGGSGVDPQKKK